jgi:hypothetical protein
VEVHLALIFSLHFLQVSLDCTTETEHSIYIYRRELVEANGFAIREDMDGGGKNRGEELFGNLHTHDL